MAPQKKGLGRGLDALLDPYSAGLEVEEEKSGAGVLTTVWLHAAGAVMSSRMSQARSVRQRIMACGVGDHNPGFLEKPGLSTAFVYGRMNVSAITARPTTVQYSAKT